jgi:hypothetical protein
MKSGPRSAGTSLLTPAQHRTVAARMRRADPQASGEQHLLQIKFARLHDLLANAIEARELELE